MKSRKSKKAASPEATPTSRLAFLLGGREGDATHATAGAGPVVLMTRVRLARNLCQFPFPGWAKEAQRRDILAACFEGIAAMDSFRDGLCVAVDDIGELEKQILFERHLISRELMGAPTGAGIVISQDQSRAIMINEEDHLRIQVLAPGLDFSRAWEVIDTLDTALEERLDYAYSPELGYLTACPTNLGTAIRGSAMMHLPGLVLANQMEKVVRAVNQLGLTVRGLFGEGSEASGSIFQISNQTTLGEDEGAILKRLRAVLGEIVDQEINARDRLMENDAERLLDKLGRAFGILRHSLLINSGEAMNLLSLVRLAIDLGLIDESARPAVDRLFIEAQPGHVQHAMGGEAESSRRDAARARILREVFETVAPPRIHDILRN